MRQTRTAWHSGQVGLSNWHAKINHEYVDTRNVHWFDASSMAWAVERDGRKAVISGIYYRVISGTVLQVILAVTVTSVPTKQRYIRIGPNEAAS